jgi:hypothetical protein
VTAPQRSALSTDDLHLVDMLERLQHEQRTTLESQRRQVALVREARATVTRTPIICTCDGTHLASHISYLRDIAGDNCTSIAEGDDDLTDGCECACCGWLRTAV